MTVLPVDVPFALLLNLLLLFCVALEPYLFSILESVDSLDLLNSESIAYALDVGVMFLLLVALALLVVKEEQKSGSAGGHRRLHPVVLRRFRRVMKAEAIVGAIFIVSALPIFWTMTPIGYLRFTLWYSSFVILPAGTLRSVRKKGATGRLRLARSQLLDGIRGKTPSLEFHATPAARAMLELMRRDSMIRLRRGIYRGNSCETR